MKLADEHSIRILQVVGAMNRGGTETWLMHILRHIDRDRFKIDFLVYTTQPCAYDDEIRALGSKIIPCLNLSQPLLFARNFKRILREYGPYDIVHSHVHHFSGYVLRLAWQAGVPVRIAHSHSDTSSLDTKSRLARRLYLALTKWWITRYATVGLAASRKTALALFGSGWETKPRWRVVYCGIDLTLFKDRIGSAAVRAELGIPTDAFVIGHVGRFAEPKNHVFLVEIAAELAKREPSARLLLIGDGPLRPKIEHKVAQMGLTNHVIFAGFRSDGPQLMLGTMDVFLFPSLYEGLPLVLLEAQAAGLPCIFSDVVTQEVEVVKPLMLRMSLLQPASAWAEAILAGRDNNLVVSQIDALAILENSQFNIKNSLRVLKEIYTN